MLLSSCWLHVLSRLTLHQSHSGSTSGAPPFDVYLIETSASSSMPRSCVKGGAKSEQNIAALVGHASHAQHACMLVEDEAETRFRRAPSLSLSSRRRRRHRKDMRINGPHFPFLHPMTPPASEDFFGLTWREDECVAATPLHRKW